MTDPHYDGPDRRASRYAEDDFAPPAPSLSRIIDFKLPLPWLLGAVGALALTLITMWFQLNQLSKEMSELQVLIRASSGQLTSVLSEQTLIKYRLEGLEAWRREYRSSDVDRRIERSSAGGQP